MIIKLRGKIWKQITPNEYAELDGEDTARFIDSNYHTETTYFKLIKQTLKSAKKPQEKSK